MIIHHPAPGRRAAVGARAGAIGSLAALALCLSALSLSGILSASAAGTNAGVAQITKPQDAPTGAGTPLATGGSSTPFTLKLPSGAACAADSANGGYRVQSYRVPGAVNPATLTFDSSGPVGHQPLYDTTGSPYVDKQTANANPPGGPGPIINIANFNYAVYGPGDIAPGTYSLGIACTHGPASATQLDRFWNVQVDIVTDATDSPAGIRWTVAAVSADTASTTSSTTTSSTTSTTVSSSSTTSTSRPSTSTSTVNSSTTTTTPAAASQSSGGTAAGAAASVASSGASSGTSSGASAGGMPRTGRSSAALLAWSFLLLCSGRIVVLLARKTAVIDSST